MSTTETSADWGTAVDQPVVDADVVAQHGPFLLRLASATVIGGQPEPTFEEWSSAFEWVQQVEKASPFWVGDLLIFGERFGEMTSQVMEATGYAQQTCYNAKHVCSVFPPETRHPAVSFSHHEVIAPIKDAEARQTWLKKADEQQLTRDQLRMQVKAATSAAAGTPIELFVVVTCTDVEQQLKLADEMRMRGLTAKITSKEPKGA